MGEYGKLLSRILDGRWDRHMTFDDLCVLLKRLGFDERIRGNQHSFSRRGIRERINLQRDGHVAKPYQVRQVRAIVVSHQLEKQRDV